MTDSGAVGRGKAWTGGPGFLSMKRQRALNSGSWSSRGRGSAPQRTEKALGCIPGGGGEEVEKKIFELLDF